MYNIVIARYGEIGIKGKNRFIFENKLVKNIKNALKEIGNPRVYKDHGRVYIEVGEYDIDEIIKEARKVFGIVSLSPAIKMEKDYEVLKEISLKVMEDAIEKTGAKTFKVECRRGDKNFRLTSPQMSIDIGGFLYSKLHDKIKVDVKNPQLHVESEIRDDCVISFAHRVSGFGGLPLGTNGKATILLSGGIDSPVAAWMVAKRGVAIEAVHFHSYPFTSEKSREKVEELGRVLAQYCGRFKMHMVNLLPIQKEINKNCKEEEMTIISRRFMMKIAQEIAVQNDANALITGESIGQVASQTIQGLTVTNDAVSIPVFRPLIAMDKSEITDMAKKIGTYETSIIPEEDCCTVFLPKHPLTKPRLDRILESEGNLDADKLVKDAIENMETISIEF